MMTRTAHTSEKRRSCRVPPGDVFAVVADLSRLPDWWLWTHPDSRLELDEYEVIDLAGAGTIAVPGAEIEIASTGGAANFKSGRRVAWGPKSSRFRCAVAEPDRHVRLLVTPGSGDDHNAVRALDIEIAPDGEGSCVTLRRESEVPGNGVLTALSRRAHSRGWALDKPLKRLLLIAEE